VKRGLVEVHILGIRVVAVSGVALEEPISATFGETEGDIGRSVDCTLTLADPDRRISRRQAVVTYRAGRHFIRQIGTNMAVELEGVPLALDVEYPIEDGAQIRISSYLLRAELRVSDPPSALEGAQGPAATRPGSEKRHPLDDLLAGIVGADRAPRPSAFDGLLGSSDPPEKPPEVDLLLGESDAPVHEQRAPQSASLEQAAPLLSASDAFAALYAGLGIPVPATVNRSAQQLQLIGSLLRKSIEGTLTLLATRAVAKRELGASTTQAQARQNNPLKFSPNGQAALTHLLGPAQPGFVAPLAALADAFEDLRAHEVAVLAGMRSALDEVLSRFDPARLEQRLAPKGLWENLLPGNREAKLWSQFGAQHAQILREAEDDFDSLFGRAFRQAYETQLAELARRPDDDES
jgi:type VI secretion system FHA domain protein